MNNISNLINFKYSNPTIINFGVGKINHIESLVTIKNAKILLIYTPSMDKHGFLKTLLSKLSNFSVYLYNNTSQNPTPEIVDSVTRLFRNNNCNFIIGIGGGSTIDFAKGISTLYTNNGDALNFMGFPRNLKNTIPIIAIPTTASTGSEVIYNAVFTDQVSKVKFGINSEKNYPFLSIFPLLFCTPHGTELLSSQGRRHALLHRVHRS